MKALKVIGWAVVGLLVVVILTVGSAFAVGRQRLAKAPDVVVRTVALPSDEASLARGRHLVRHVVGCSGCHGADLGGGAFFDDPAMGSVPAANLTTGVGGFGRAASLEDWVRAVRHGVGRDGRVLGAMPADAYAHLSDEDLGAVLAYVMRAPPVDRPSDARRLTPLGTVVFGTLGFSSLPFTKIDHAAAPVPHPTEGVSVEYGRYIAHIATCADCHGADFRGYQGPPGPPPGPDITGGGALRGWGAEDFVHLLRTGVRPDGRPLSPSMPFAGYAGMTDDELTAMYLYLSGLSATR
jgi:mono/diheme cytochrome c family protein